MIKPRQLTKAEVLRILREEQPYLRKAFGVKRMAIFGSFAKGKPTSKSDVDIFVDFEGRVGMKFFRLIDYLETRLGREVDVLTPGGIETIQVERVAKDIKGSLIDV